VTAATRPDVTPPAAPVLSVPNVSPSQIWLSWTESTDDLPSSSVGYSVFVNGELATNLNWINHRQASLRHLSPDTTYTFKVTARDGSGNATDSNSVSVETLPSSDTVPPPAPTNLRIDFDQGCAEVWLAWEQSTDDVDAQSAIEYETYVNGALTPLAVDVGVGRSFAYGTVDGFNSFVVKAVDRSGKHLGAQQHGHSRALDLLARSSLRTRRSPPRRGRGQVRRRRLWKAQAGRPLAWVVSPPSA
jgi:Fibronectin type III domain